MDEPPGLRERKKAATRQALHEAAVRLAAEHGYDRLTVEAIADAAGVSRRTFSNYFAGKEEALFHGDDAWLHRMLELVRSEPAGERPWALLCRVAERLITEGGPEPDPTNLARRREARRHPVLVVQQAAAYSRLESELGAELAGRLTGTDAGLRARVLAATFLAVLRVTIQHWTDSPEGPLLDTVRAGLSAAAPA